MLTKILGYILGTCLFCICLSIDNRKNRVTEKPIEYIDKDYIRCSAHQWETLSKEEKIKIKYVELKD